MSESITLNQLTLFAEDSHAKTCPSRGKDSVSAREHDQDYGQNFTESFANYDQDTRLWRTQQGCFLSEWAEFLETWPKSGMMRNGKCYRQKNLGHSIYEKECFSLPTPQASDYKGGSKNGRDGELKHFLKRRFGGNYPNPELLEALMMFPICHTELNPSETQ